MSIDELLLHFSVLFIFCVLSKLIAIHVQVTLVELVRPSPSLPEILSEMGNSVVGADRMLKQILDDLAVSDGIQARMDGIMFQKLDGADYSSPILMMMKDYLGSL